MWGDLPSPSLLGKAQVGSVHQFHQFHQCAEFGNVADFSPNSAHVFGTEKLAVPPNLRGRTFKLFLHLLAPMLPHWSFAQDFNIYYPISISLTHTLDNWTNHGFFKTLTPDASGG
jgi:hypothetical protein